MNRRPNVVFILTDDQGYPPMGAHGHPFIQTPNLDDFHAEAVRFEQFHTGTTCAPTRAGLLTGHHCNSTGVWHTIGGRSLLRQDEWTLADALRSAGYRTGMFGKWHLGDEFPFRPQDRGFDHGVCHGGGGISQQPDHWGNDYFDDTYQVNGRPQAFEGYCTDVFFREALRFIEENRNQPFFCYISTNAPHGPFNVEPRYRDLYTDRTESENYARFLGMITNIDENFGALRRRLRELNLENDTILVFMSDNGQTGVGPVKNQYNAGMRGLKGSPYEGGHRVPFLLRWPQGGFATAQTLNELTAYIDFMPTILGLCGVEVPPERNFHGESLVPLLRGTKDGHWRTRALVTDTQRIAYPMKWRKSCVMQDNWRLVQGRELYNLINDPGQQSDIAADHPDVVAQLRAAYEEWWDLCSDQMEREVPTPLGAPGYDRVVLRTHDMRSEQSGDMVWNQAGVRRGTGCLGWWEVRVKRDAQYEVELRRWPEEAGHAIGAGIDGPDVPYREDAVSPDAHAWYRDGKALNFDTACLDVEGVNRWFLPVTPDRPGVPFHVNLPAGNHRLRATFSNAEGAYMSAYYVYITAAAT